ncbi:TetR family transcriptional regulator [Antrihabitans sp. YC3-6]|uniref:TetR family transcriptional regulator n=1 Tax=Antrihabitans stalagmiti TaxID=2799499 RepID=A0A934NNJ7_9NOCA|nr:TetR family transcriptional regulator [Antrihabitans stalagmiti]MBJ8338484.1 TetR family transcriptional regulator [Antrihabitans stalagmiti]
MPADTTVPSIGLRERKKARTRATIRSEAFRLFEEQGYAETTIEQIAEAADVSPSTFFRYFPTKEQLVLADDLDPAMIQAVAAQPSDVPMFAAIRLAAEALFNDLTPEDVEFERRRTRLLYSVPELKRAVTQEMMRTIDMLAEMMAERTGRSADDTEVRAHAGAMVGAIVATMNENTNSPTDALRAVRYLEDGLPLGR